MTQGQLNVSDYYQKFDKLSYYFSHKIERDRIERFKKVLSPAIQHKVGSLRFEYVLDAVEIAIMAELRCNRLRREGGEPNRKMNDFNRFENRSGNQNQFAENRKGNQERNDMADGNANQADKR